MGKSPVKRKKLEQASVAVRSSSRRRSLAELDPLATLATAAYAGPSSRSTTSGGLASPMRVLTLSQERPRLMLPELGPGDKPRLHLKPRESAGIQFEFQATEPGGSWKGCLVVTGYATSAAEARARVAGAWLGRALVSVNGTSLTDLAQDALLSRLGDVSGIPRQLGFSDPPQSRAAPEAVSVAKESSESLESGPESPDLTGEESLTPAGTDARYGAAEPVSVAHDDPFSTPARRRRLTFSIATQLVRDYLRRGAALAITELVRRNAVTRIQCRVKLVLAQRALDHLRAAARDTAASAIQHFVRASIRRQRRRLEFAVAAQTRVRRRLASVETAQRREERRALRAAVVAQTTACRQLAVRLVVIARHKRKEKLLAALLASLTAAARRTQADAWDRWDNTTRRSGVLACALRSFRDYLLSRATDRECRQRTAHRRNAAFLRLRAATHLGALTRGLGLWRRATACAHRADRGAAQRAATSAATCLHRLTVQTAVEAARDCLAAHKSANRAAAAIAAARARALLADCSTSAKIARLARHQGERAVQSPLRTPVRNAPMWSDVETSVAPEATPAAPQVGKRVCACCIHNMVFLLNPALDNSKFGAVLSVSSATEPLCEACRRAGAGACVQDDAATRIQCLRRRVMAAEQRRERLTRVVAAALAGPQRLCRRVVARTTVSRRRSAACRIQAAARGRKVRLLARAARIAEEAEIYDLANSLVEYYGGPDFRWPLRTGPPRFPKPSPHPDTEVTKIVSELWEQIDNYEVRHNGTRAARHTARVASTRLPDELKLCTPQDHLAQYGPPDPALDDRPVSAYAARCLKPMFELPTGVKPWPVGDQNVPTPSPEEAELIRREFPPTSAAAFYFELLMKTAPPPPNCIQSKLHFLRLLERALPRVNVDLGEMPFPDIPWIPASEVQGPKVTRFPIH